MLVLILALVNGLQPSPGDRRLELRLTDRSMSLSRLPR